MKILPSEQLYMGCLIILKCTHFRFKARKKKMCCVFWKTHDDKKYYILNSYLRFLFNLKYESGKTREIKLREQKLCPSKCASMILRPKIKWWLHVQPVVRIVPEVWRRFILKLSRLKHYYRVIKSWFRIRGVRLYDSSY